MTLSAKDIARLFLLFGSAVPLEQLSGDSLENWLENLRIISAPGLIKYK